MKVPTIHQLQHKLAKGFTILEIMVVILLIGVIAAISIPRFLRSPVPVAEQFMGNLNSMVIQAAEQAQQDGEPRRIFFNLLARSVELQDVADREVGGRLAIPDVLEITDVVINNVSQFQAGGIKRTFYFLINADGISQEVRLIITEQTDQGEQSYEVLLNPFTSSFRLV